MFQAQVNLRKAILGCTASVLALSAAMPAYAQQTNDNTKPKPKVASDQSPGQPAGTNAPEQEIVITGLRASIQASLDRKKKSDIVSEVVTAQDIGKFPDKNVADSLGRLTGVNVVTGSAKNVQRGKAVCSFGFGSQELYDTIHDNADFSCQPVEMTNLPHLIMQNDRLVTINNTTQMDLQGQASSESSGHRHISGTGGQLQFVRAGYASNGGKSFICMSSTYERGGVRRSRIVPELTSGNVVTAPRSDMMFVVTEYGLVNLVQLIPSIASH